MATERIGLAAFLRDQLWRGGAGDPKVGQALQIASGRLGDRSCASRGWLGRRLSESRIRNKVPKQGAKP